MKKTETPRSVNAGILFLRFLGAHLLILVCGLMLSLLSLPLWTGLIYGVSGRESTANIAWEWYLLTLAPFYVAITTLTILVVYPMWTAASARMKIWRRVATVILWIHAVILLGVNLVLGGRALP